ncbi:hypothetical protein [Burkholderia sp. LMU1-1-1.1]|uniref:hypothetical protein n=1 Tax=Burkholderia sp. LMU1-1-1.1 TaxID=3135266 RepID=UPI00343CB807
MSEITLDTSEKIISAIAGIIAIGSALFWFFRRRTNDENVVSASPVTNNANQTVTVNVATESSPNDRPGAFDIMELKRKTHILFVDDDRGFKIVGVLKKMGWENTKLVTDISSLEQGQLLAADVIFVDIQGVGRAMQYSDEGLGLSLAIKRRHPIKKVIIYSAEENGARFHEALQEADYSLPKTAEPIRFEDTIVKVLTK